MSRAPLTADGRHATTQIALASILGCNRDTLREWRREGAPDTLELAAWRQWLLATGRSKLATSLPADPTAPPEAPVNPPPESAPADDGADWEERGKRARALLAERQLAEADGRLVDRRLVVQVGRELGAAVAARLGVGIIEALLEPLAAASPQLRAQVRAAHDRAILGLRAELAALPREALARLLPPVGAPC